MTTAKTLDATSVLLDLEREARHAGDADAFRFVAVNQTRRLIAYRQAILFRFDGPRARRPYRVEAVSNVPSLDRHAPFLIWLEDAARAFLAEPAGAEAGNPLEARVLRPGDLPDTLRGDWADFMLPDVLWVPLPTPDGTPVGALWLSREGAWSDGEQLLLGRLADTYGHAWQSLDARTQGRRRRRAEARPVWRKALPWVAGVAALAALAFPVRQSTLAPAEVVPREPLVVSAPLEGVLKSFHVRPNEPVSAGQPLFAFEDEPLRSRRDIAGKSLALAEAELRKAVQSAFADTRSKAEVALLQARVELRQSELEHAEAQLARATVVAPRDGIAVFTDINDWLGRPVQTGERVLTIADPGETELRADLAVSDAIALEPGTPVTIFLAADPLAPVDAELTHASYEARMTDQGVLAYSVRARFIEDGPPPRVGLKGTAKLHGETVPLALYLFRRPLATVRQMLGV